MIKVCLDTNIYISALLFDKKPEEILFMGAGGQIEIISSPPILEEVREVLTKKFHRTETDARRLLKSITSISKVSTPLIKVKKLKYQPDNRILEAALEGEVDCIVTGDKKHLLSLREFKNIPIITPGQFLKEFEKE